MFALLRCLKSDFYKLRHTSILWIHLLIPIAAALMFLTYYGASSRSAIMDIRTYLDALAITFPLLIGLISGVVIEQEEQAGNFQTLLCSTKSKCITYLSKLTLLLLFGSFSTLLGVGIFALGFQTVPNLFYLKAAGALVAGNIFIYILHLFISLKFGKGPSVGLGIAGSLICALMQVGLGARIWYFIPWSWSVKLCDNMIAMWIRPSFSAEIAFDTQKGLLVMLFAIGISFFVSLFWFTKWDGRKSYD